MFVIPEEERDHLGDCFKSSGNERISVEFNEMSGTMREREGKDGSLSRKCRTANVVKVLEAHK
jgi:hypothetical protein